MVSEVFRHRNGSVMLWFPDPGRSGEEAVRCRRCGVAAWPGGWCEPPRAGSRPGLALLMLFP